MNSIIFLVSNFESVTYWNSVKSAEETVPFYALLKDVLTTKLSKDILNDFKSPIRQN
jgi:hypothetical protein